MAAKDVIEILVWTSFNFYDWLSKLYILYGDQGVLIQFVNQLYF